MYDPRFRFLMVVLLISFAVWAYILVSDYLIGPRGLNVERYIHGVFIVSAAVLGGFLFVWLSVRFMNLRENRKTGFEATNEDETGTVFNLKLSLTKFLPELVAPPPPDDITPLESELIGFLNSLGTWPYDLARPDQTLRDHALLQWEAMRQLAGAGPMHRAAALAQDLGKVYAYKEERRLPEPWEFWKQDKVKYSLRCHEHGSMAAFILSSMPSFRPETEGKSPQEQQQDQRQRRALLTAIRYAKEPSKMPENCDPLAREIYDFLNKAHLKAREMAGDQPHAVDPTPEDMAALEEETQACLLNVLLDMDFDPGKAGNRADGLYLTKNQLAVRRKSLVQKLLQMLSPQVRSAFQLWDLETSIERLEEPLPRILKNLGLLTETWQEEEAEEGLFHFTVNNHVFPQCFLLTLDTRFEDLLKRLEAQPKAPGIIDIQQSPENRLAAATQKAQAMEDQLTEIFPRE
jgi:hypothetical protein